MKKTLFLLLLLINLLFLTSCSSSSSFSSHNTNLDAKISHNVSYKKTLNLAELHSNTRKMVTSMLKSKELSTLPLEKRPVVTIEYIQNFSDVAFDTTTLTQTVKNELIKSGRFRLNKSKKDSEIILGTDYQIKGEILPFFKKKKVRVPDGYELNLHLLDLKKNETVWEGRSLVAL